MRHQWIVDTMWDIFIEDQSGFDILAEAADSAHAYGIEFYALIKPFEGGAIGQLLPHSFPFPKNANALRDIRGIYPVARPFVARNPHMCLKRRPGTFEFRGTLAKIQIR